MKTLYICSGNCFRSPVAEALTKKYKPELEAKSAGVDPTNFIAENAQNLLKNKNALSYVKDSPDPITQSDIDEADRIVVMEKNHREYLFNKFQMNGKDVECWGVDDPVRPDVDPEKSFKKIEDRVRAL